MTVHSICKSDDISQGSVPQRELTARQNSKTADRLVGGELDGCDVVSVSRHVDRLGQSRLCARRADETRDDLDSGFDSGIGRDLNREVSNCFTDWIILYL